MKGKGENKTGYYSSHGAMVPMGPAFTSDGSQYLGRPRRPRYAGSAGQPSMHADSGFSSVDGLGRVNKGYEGEIEMEPMFPDQSEEGDEEIFTPLRTRKLPVYTIAIHPGIGRGSFGSIKEGFLPGFVGDFLKSAGLSVPGVDILIGNLILDKEAEAAKLSLEKMSNIIGINTNDLAASLIDPNDDPMILIMQKVCDLSDQDRLNARDFFRDFLESFKDFIVTLVQTYDSVAALLAGPAAPEAEVAVNFISGISGFFTRVIPIERLVFNLSSRLARMITGVMEISEILEQTSPKYRALASKFESDFGPVFSAIRAKPALSLSRLGTLYASLSGDRGLCMADDLPKSEEAEAEIEEEIEGDDVQDQDEDIGPEIPEAEVSLAIEASGFPEAEGCVCPISEARFRLLENRYNRIVRKLEMSESTLRQFVREMLREASEEDEEVDDRPSRYGGRGYLPSDVLPYGQEYIGEEEQEGREDIGDEYIISYKGDEGYSMYGARPESLREIALRRIIREETKKLLGNDDSKKKMTKMMKSPRTRLAVPQL